MAKKLFPNVVTRWLEVGPEMAMRFVSKSRFNRPLDAAKVARYADVMKAGRWGRTHQGIAFDWDGFLIDGQHRLHAIIASGVTVLMAITEGLDPNSFQDIDVPSSQRGMPDLIGMAFGGARGWTKQQDILAAARLNAILLLLQNRRPGSTDRKATIDWAVEFLPAVEWSLKAMPGGNAAEQAMVAGVLAYAHTVEPEAIEEILPRLKTGVMLDGPLATLSKRILEKGRSVVGCERRPLGLLTLSAIYCYLKKGLKLTASQRLADDALAYFREKYTSKFGAAPASRAKAA